MEKREIGQVQIPQELKKQIAIESEATPEPIEQRRGAISLITQWVDRNGRYIQWGLFGVGLTGLYIMGRSIRLGTRFTDPKLIPKEFYGLNFSLFGHVHKIKTIEKLNKPDEFTQVFSIQHEPIMMPFWRGRKIKNPELDNPNNGLLRIVVPSLNIYEKYVPDVERYLKSKIVRFTLVRYDEDYKAAMCVIHTKGIFKYKSVAKWCLGNKYASLGTIDNRDLQSIKSGRYYYEMCKEDYRTNKNQTGILRRFYDLIKWCMKPRKN